MLSYFRLTTIRVVLTALTFRPSVMMLMEKHFGCCSKPVGKSDGKVPTYLGQSAMNSDETAA